MHKLEYEKDTILLDKGLTVHARTKKQTPCHLLDAAVSDMSHSPQLQRQTSGPPLRSTVHGEIRQMVNLACVDASVIGCRRIPKSLCDGS